MRTTSPAPPTVTTGTLDGTVRVRRPSRKEPKRVVAKGPFGTFFDIASFIPHPVPTFSEWKTNRRADRRDITTSCHDYTVLGFVHFCASSSSDNMPVAVILKDKWLEIKASEGELLVSLAYADLSQFRKCKESEMVCLVAKNARAVGNVSLPTLSFLFSTRKIGTNFVTPLISRIGSTGVIFVDEAEQEFELFWGGFQAAAEAAQADHAREISRMETEDAMTSWPDEVTEVTEGLTEYALF